MSRFPTADKRFGQHFLHSPHVIKPITTDAPAGCDAIIEVGPGPAVLTPHLKEHKLPLYAFEMDKRFTEILTAVVGEDNLILGDALEIDFEAFLKERGHENVWLVSNLPYNVSVPLTLAFMRAPRLQRMTLMYQKEVAEKFLPRSGKNTMSSLHALAGMFFKTSRVVDVPPGAFQPPPKVMSQVIRFDRLTTPHTDLKDWDQLEGFMRAVFQNRRKQLRGLIKDRIPGEVLDEFFRAQQIPEGVRAEALELEQVIALWRLDQRHHMV
jgi:16S rRNA (adenine1518-N6/adenine1519-N6)-dimethyltransferase